MTKYYNCEEKSDYTNIIIGHTATKHHDNFLSIKEKCLKSGKYEN